MSYYYGNRLTDDQFEDLSFICEEPEFIVQTLAIITSLEGVGKRVVVRHSKEIEKVSKFLSEISEELRWEIKLSHATRMYLKKIESDRFIPLKCSQIHFDPTPEDDLVEQMQSAFEKILNDRPLDGEYSRARIGASALEIFNRFGIHAGSSKTGVFTEYISIIRDALGLKFNAQAAARVALKKASS